MTHSAIATAIKKRVPTVPKALAALAAMEKQLASSKTYDEIKHIIREATALNVLLGHVAEVKAQAEDTILIANRRIGEEIRKVPKASGRPAKIVTAPGKNKRADIMPGTSRARLQKLAGIPVADLKAVSRDLRAAGKDATVSAVVRQITQGDKKQRRADRERQLGARQCALPDQKFGVALEDFEWDFEVRSRETGMDRHAANHYETAADAHTPEEIVTRTKDRFSVLDDDCVLFMWVPIPFLAIGIRVLELRGFKYKSNIAWGKDKAGPGFWIREKHEHLLIGVRGNIPCPAPGEQWESLQISPRGRHSEKPTWAYELIEHYFPNLPKIEFNARSGRAGWVSWGNEAPQEAA
jgi:N6-adenosine-specific RNA methylase IME4